MIMSDGKKYFGEVIWFSVSKGFGFIAWSNESGVKQKDMFVHFSDVSCEGFKTLFKDQKVSFELGTNKNGDPKAVNVAVLRN